MDIYTIYKFTNKINGKCYVGKTKNFHRRIHQHFSNSQSNKHTLFYNALKKYGKNSFDIDILFQSTSNLISEDEFTNIYEPLLIAEHKSYYMHNGYNSTLGGIGFDSNVGKKVQIDLIKKERHLFKGKIPVVDKKGNRMLIKKEIYEHQNKENKEYVHFNSKEGVKRTGKSSNFNNNVLVISLIGKYEFISKNKYNSQKGNMNSWEYVAPGSIEGLRRLNKSSFIPKNITIVDEFGNKQIIPRKLYLSQKGKKSNWEYININSKEGLKRLNISRDYHLTKSVSVVNKQGKIIRMPKELYYKQQKDNINDLEYVLCTSKEGLKRLGRIHKFIGNVMSINVLGEIKLIPKEEYHNQKGEPNSFKWVSIGSNEGKRRKLNTK